MWVLTDFSQAQNPERPQFLILSFTFTSDDTKEVRIYTEPFVPDLSAAPKLASDWLRQYNKILNQIASPLSLTDLQSGVDALLNPPAPSDPTPDQVAQSLYSQAKSVLQQLNDLVSNEVIAADDQSIVDAKVAVVTTGQVVLPIIQTQLATVQTSISTKISGGAIKVG